VVYTEELREALLNLEEARKREAQQRQIAEALLAGLRVLVATADHRNIFPNLFIVLRSHMDFQAAFVLTAGAEGSFSPTATSHPVFEKTIWTPGALFRRTLAGNPTAIFDTTTVEEWTSQPEEVREASGSALLFSISTEGRQALFVCTHPERAHFSRNHIKLARRFSVLAAKALQNLESENHMVFLKEKLETEARLAELNRKLAENEKELARTRRIEALGLLAGGVAHDLNNILSGVVSYPDLLLMQTDIPQKHRRAIEIIRNSGLRAASVVQDLLTLARGVALTKEPLQLNTVVQQFLKSREYIDMLGGHTHISVRTQLDGSLMNVRASRVHVEKTLLHLISNALDAVRAKTDGRIVVTTENRYVDRPLHGYKEIVIGEYVVTTISDNGGGIHEDDLERIFEPFYAKKIMGRSGAGLGLTIVWNTMQEHDGYIELATGKEGTQFSLYFPAVRESLQDPSSRTLLDLHRGRGERILVVDDQEDQRRIACAMLDAIGYETAAVSGGEEAVAYIEKQAVDLLLLDMIMAPGIDGRQTYERILRIRPGQKAVIASGYSLTDDVRATLKMGAGAFIKKPYRLDALAAAVRNELAPALRETGNQGPH
jgi:signal transduction histidine kinase/ActR/RegA family two-component response regulator